MADEAAWRFVSVLPAEPSNGIPVRASWQITTAHFVTLFRDSERRLAYTAALSTLGQEAAARFLYHSIASLELAGLETWTDEELINAVSAASDPGEHASAVIRAGLGAPATIAEPWVAAFFTAARHPAEEVRAAGIQAIMHADWPMFAELLHAMAKEDLSRRIRKQAKRNALVLQARATTVESRRE
jgi:hypothetical protein